MFIDILGRIQHWSGIVQNKLDICKNDIEALRRELKARACEIAALTKKLADCEDREGEMVATQTEVQEQVVEEITEKDHQDEAEDKSYEDSKIGPDDLTQDTEEKEEKLLETGRLEIICTDAAIQSMAKDKERMRRELELEAEIARLRKENERIVKERAEYENAIQRALLRGVSSLNVEALRVLRCPPIPCCTPCAPCPGSVAEPIAACRREATPRGCVAQRTAGAKNGARKQSCCIVKRPCASPCCSAVKSRNSSMVFLLHQGDTGNIHVSNDTAVPRVCGSPVMKKIEIPRCPRFSR
ncbi:uncharacterized protein LOC143373129 isoform X2 [Andrena cerasifolii]